MNDSNRKNIVFISFLLVLVTVFGLLLSGCETSRPYRAPPPAVSVPVESTPADTTITETVGSGDLKVIKTDEELAQFFAERKNTQNNNYYGGVMMKSLGASRELGGIATTDAVAAPTAQGSAGAEDYSHTNVQVEGVDEADFIKNDDRYIYMVKDRQLIIVDALDAKNAKIISKTELGENGNAQQLFVYKDKIVVFFQSNEESFYLGEYDARPYPTYKQVTYALMYDITDKSNPTLIDTAKISGNYYQSRMIGGMVYFVTQDYPNYQYIEPPYVQMKATVIRPEIYYFDNEEQDYTYNTITSLDLDNEKVVESKTFLLGYSNTLMVSENNIYIAYQKNNYFCWRFRCNNDWEKEQKDKFFSVVVPLLPSDVKGQILDIKDQNLERGEEWSKISVVLKIFYKDVMKNQNKYEELFAKIDDAIQEYDAKNALERSKTTIHKIKITDGHIDYQDKGEVSGRLLNQFSMDEYDGNLRVATTIDIWTSKRTQYNNVYVLDNNMQIIGSLKGVAENESIYSTRFMGDRLYMVTFRQIDPFFVIDLKNPSKPRILGQLKISGYSSYLHPYNENLIIGVGKETGTNQWGGTSIEGIKISLFDVSDFNNPKEVDKYEIGEQGSDSAALYDHKAFMFSKSKNLMVIPVTAVTSKTKTSEWSYNYNTWNGAYVFKITESGFDLLGKVRHSSSTNSWFNWYDDATVSRSLYMDDNLYTVSNKYIKINDLTNNLNELNSIELPKIPDVYYGKPVPMMDSVSGGGSAGVAVASVTSETTPPVMSK